MWTDDRPHPPHNEAAERALIGHALNLGRIPEDVNGLTASDFWRQEHETIWATMRSLIAQGKPCDIYAVRNHLENHGQLTRGTLKTRGGVGRSVLSGANGSTADR